jgi:hypothetical protein
MDPESRKKSDQRDLWRRLLFMALFTVLYGLAKAVLTVVVIVQFIVIFTTGSANNQLLKLGSALSIYAYQIIRYLTFNSDSQPFPLSEWPQDESEQSPWRDEESSVYDSGSETEELQENDQTEPNAADLRDNADNDEVDR